MGFVISPCLCVALRVVEQGDPASMLPSKMLQNASGLKCQKERQPDAFLCPTRQHPGLLVLRGVPAEAGMQEFMACPPS